MKLSIVNSRVQRRKADRPMLGTRLRGSAGERLKRMEAPRLSLSITTPQTERQTWRSAGAEVVFEPINQISRARNAGGGAAQGDWFLFIDADSFLDAASVADLLRCIVQGKMAGGGCVVGLDEAPAYVFPLIRLCNYLMCTLRWAAGSFVFCRRDAFLEIGGFSTDLYAAEEIDFSRKLKGWAKQKGLGFAVLRDQAHLSSGRKFYLYSRWEVFAMSCARCSFYAGRSAIARNSISFTMAGGNSDATGKLRPTLRWNRAGSRERLIALITALREGAKGFTFPNYRNRRYVPTETSVPLLDHFASPLSVRRPWESFQTTWASTLADILNRDILPPGYIALEQVHAGAAIEIDVATCADPGASATGHGAGGTATVTRTVWKPAAAPTILPWQFPPSCTVEILATEGGRAPWRPSNLLAPPIKIVALGGACLPPSAPPI